MNYKQTFSKMIREGSFDKRLYHGIGHRRVFRHGVEQLRLATDPLVAQGRMSESGSRRSCCRSWPSASRRSSRASEK